MYTSNHGAAATVLRIFIAGTELGGNTCCFNSDMGRVNVGAAKVNEKSSLLTKVAHE